MAFSSVKVQFELGHEAAVRNKRTPEGFTHDWEVFVRGADNSDISHFVDRVVFHLHETFLKPKRVIKDPPYSVKESGYAGFVLPIEIHFKNQNEPKKVRFDYDLTLPSQTIGQRAPISVVLREKYVFNNPTEDLRRRLIRGGGVGVTPSMEKATASLNDDVPSVAKHTVPLVGKPKLGGDVGKKQKIKDEPRVNDQFANLFGTPIHTSRASPEVKKAASSSSKSSDKVEKHSSKEQTGGKSKHLPLKESGSSKDDRTKDRDKSKEKSSKRVPTPPKRPPSPSKRSQSPKTTPSKKSSPKRPVTPTLKDDPKKMPDDLRGKDGKLVDEKIHEKKKKDKKNKEDKSKRDRKSSEKKGEIFDKSEKSKDTKEKKLPKELPITISKEPEKIKTKHSEIEKDKEKQKHKHKKKDKNKQDDESCSSKDKKRDKVKTSKIDDKVPDNDRERNGFEKESSRSSSHSSTNKKTDRNDSPSPVRPKASPAKHAVTPDKPSTSKEKTVKPPLKRLMDEYHLSDPDSSNSKSSSSDDEDPVDAVPSKKESKTSESFRLSSATKASQSIENVVNSYSRSPTNVKTPFQESATLHQNGKQKDKSDSRVGKDSKKKSLNKVGDKSQSVGKDESAGEKNMKRKRNSSGKEVKSIEPPDKMPKQLIPSEMTKLPESVPLKADESSFVVSGAPRPIDLLKPHMVDGKFTADYVDQLKHLQHKIMTLDDNEELQRVVQVIAETGQYEITPKTFDFDLCTLDLVTVKRLQDFFTTS